MSSERERVGRLLRQAFRAGWWSFGDNRLHGVVDRNAREDRFMEDIAPSLAAIALPEETGALGWVVVEHDDKGLPRIVSQHAFPKDQAQFLCESDARYFPKRHYTVEPVGAPQGAEPIAWGMKDARGFFDFVEASRARRHYAEVFAPGYDGDTTAVPLYARIPTEERSAP